MGFVKPTDDRKIILVLDNHNSHRTLEAITKAKENNLVREKPLMDLRWTFITDVFNDKYFLPAEVTNV